MLEACGYIERVVESDFFLGKDLYYIIRAHSEMSNPLIWFSVSNLYLYSSHQSNHSLYKSFSKLVQLLQHFQWPNIVFPVSRYSIFIVHLTFSSCLNKVFLVSKHIIYGIQAKYFRCLYFYCPIKVFSISKKQYFQCQNMVFPMLKHGISSITHSHFSVHR